MRIKAYFDFDDRNYSERDDSDFITLDIAELPQRGSIFHFHPLLEDLTRIPIPSWKIEGYKLETANKEELVDALLNIPWYVSMIYFVVDPMKHVDYYIELKEIY